MKGGEGVRYDFSFFMFFFVFMVFVGGREEKKNLGPTRTMNDPTRDMGWYVV